MNENQQALKEALKKLSYFELIKLVYTNTAGLTITTLFFTPALFFVAGFFTLIVKYLVKTILFIWAM